MAPASLPSLGRGNGGTFVLAPAGIGSAERRFEATSSHGILTTAMYLARLLLTVGILSLCASASAATPVAKEKARAKAEEAEKRYNVGDFQAALDGYKEAYLLTTSPGLLFNIGQCQWKLGDDRGALHSYRAYLRTMPNPPNRSLVDARIAALEERLHAIEASQAKAARHAEPGQTALPGATAPVVHPLDLTPTPGVGEADGLGLAASPVQAAPSESPRFYTRWWFWTGAATVVAGTVAAILLLRSSPKDPSCPAGASCG